MKKKITPRINEKSENFLKKNFKNMNAGAEYILDSIQAVSRIYMGHQLKGKFTALELKLMLDVMNGTMLTAQFAGQHLLGNVEDGIALDKLDKKWEIDGDTLIKKIKSLSIPDIFFLEIWIQGFWAQSSDITLEKHIKELIKEDD